MLQLYEQGAAEVLVGNFDTEGGADGEVVADYVIVLPTGEARLDFLRTWGGHVAETRDGHKKCVVVYRDDERTEP